MLKLPVFIFLLCVIHNVFGEEQQIKLEDIERDNLLSEKQTQINEALQIQQSQHVSAPGGIQYGSPIQYQVSHGGYSFSSPQYPVEYKQNLGNDVQYVTLPPSVAEEYQYVASDQSAKPVHEASSHTMSADSRQTLITPQKLSKSEGFPLPTPQPQYVYVSAGQVAGKQLTTAQPAQQDEQKYSGGGVTYAQNDASYAQQIAYNYAPPSPQTYFQYSPSAQALTAPKIQQSYISPTVGQNFVYVPQYVPQPIAQPTPQYPQYAQYAQYAQRPLVSSVTYLSSQPTAVPSPPPAPKLRPSPSPLPNFQFKYVGPTSVPQIFKAASPAQFSSQPHEYVYSQLKALYQPQHPVAPQPIPRPYNPQPHHQSAYITQPIKVGPIASPHQFTSGTPSLDFFGQYNGRHQSLLASYIPSSVILEKQRTYLQQNPLNGHQLQYSLPQPSPKAPIQIPSGSYLPPQSAYNTIAYSVPAKYTINNDLRGNQLRKRSQSTKLQPQPKKQN